jgi:hypothetical protein
MRKKLTEEEKGNRRLARAKRYREEHPGYNVKHISKYQNSRKRFLKSVKMKTGCVDCGYKDDGRQLHFDHVIGKKLYNIERWWSLPEDKLMEELDKCEVRCRWCHVIRHRKVRMMEKQAKEYEEFKKELQSQMELS